MTSAKLRGMRVPAVVLLTLVVYNGHGIPFLYFPDSAGYLKQGLSFFDAEGYQRSAARSIGYPAFLAVVTRVPESALAMVLVQGLAAVLAYAVLWRHVRGALPGLATRQPKLAQACLAALALWLCATASYSALHNYIAAMLPEALFAVLGILALAAVTRVLLVDRISGRMLVEAAIAGVLCALPMLMKPHWLFAGPMLAALLVAKLGWLAARAPARSRAYLVRTGWVAAACVPLLAFGLMLWPERHLDKPSADAVAAFGARSIFCNRLPLIDRVLAGNPGLRIARSDEAEASLRATMRALLDGDTAPWKVMGFDGDRCMYDANLQELVARHFPDPQAQRAFYLGAYTTALRADPLPFVGMLLRQIVLGVEKTFDMFAVHTPYFPTTERLTEHYPRFLDGISPVAAGPLNDAVRTRTTVPGWIVNGFLGVFFWAHQIAYFVAFAATLLLPAFRWRTWEAPRRRAFLAYVALPLLVILAHHAVVGISHTFDIRRYAFNLFFVNLAFVASAGLFWLDEAITARDARRAGSGAA